MSLENLTVTRKLGLGFGLLLALAVLLAATGLQGLRNDQDSFARITQLGGLFDETVFAREANFKYAFNADAAELDAHQTHLQALTQALDEVNDDLAAGRWPAEDSQILQRLVSELAAYREARSAAQAMKPANNAAIIEANELLSQLQDSINVLYKKEEERSAASVSTVVSTLWGVAIAALLLGALIAWGIARQIIVPLQQTLHTAERIAEGDLTVELHSNRRDELGQLLRAIGNMSGRLRGVINQIGSSSSQLATSATQLAAITTQTQAGADSQKTDADRVASAIDGHEPDRPEGRTQLRRGRQRCPPGRQRSQRRLGDFR